MSYSHDLENYVRSVAEAHQNEIRVTSKGEACRRVIDAVRSRIPFYF